MDRTVLSLAIQRCRRNVHKEAAGGPTTRRRAQRWQIDKVLT